MKNKSNTIFLVSGSAFGTTTPSDLMKAFNDTVYGTKRRSRPKLPVDAPVLFADWYKIPGYPVLKVNRRGKKLIITQVNLLESKKKIGRYVDIIDYWGGEISQKLSHFMNDILCSSGRTRYQTPVPKPSFRTSIHFSFASFE